MFISFQSISAQHSRASHGVVFAISDTFHERKNDLAKLWWSSPTVSQADFDLVRGLGAPTVKRGKLEISVEGARDGCFYCFFIRLEAMAGDLSDAQVDIVDTWLEDARVIDRVKEGFTSPLRKCTHGQQSVA